MHEAGLLTDTEAVEKDILHAQRVMETAAALGVDLAPVMEVKHA
jgi:hypothetical protein